MTETPPPRNTTREIDGRYRLRAYLWQDFPRPAQRKIRVSSCGRVPVGGMVEVKASGQASGLGGLSTCGSVWVCPVCSPKVAATRSGEVQTAIRAWQARGGSVLLMTLTLSHGAHHRLSDSWDAIGKGWASVRNGKPWKHDSAVFGIAGYLRVIEVTRSEVNGWHPHAHVLLFVTGTPTDQDCEALRERVFGRWSRRLAKHGYRSLDFDRDGRAIGVDVRRADAHTVEYLAEYLTKFGYSPRLAAAGLALEVARGDLKAGRSGSRTPWEVLEDAHQGDRASVSLWSEWEETSQGRRQYAWAVGFLDSLALDEVKSDLEVAAEVDAQMEVVALLRNSTWADLVKDLRRTHRRPGAPLMTMMLSKAATLDPDAFRHWLTLRGIPHLHPLAAGLILDPSTGGFLDATAGPRSVAGLAASDSMIRVHRHRQAVSDRRREGALPSSARMAEHRLLLADRRAARSVGSTLSDA